MTEPSGAVRGRPQKDIDPEQVRALAAIHCTLAEIGAVLDCSVDTLERHFADIIEKGKQQGRMSLRREQWKAARAGNVTMLIWLGKNLLQQRDVMQLDVASKDGKGLAVTEEYDYSQLGVEELRQLEELTRKALRRPAGMPDVPPGSVEVKAITNGANGSNGNGTTNGEHP
jgi:hypothetical protein